VASLAAIRDFLVQPALTVVGPSRRFAHRAHRRVWGALGQLPKAS
jgi:hypothetical protein